MLSECRVSAETVELLLNHMRSATKSPNDSSKSYTMSLQDICAFMLSPPSPANACEATSAGGSPATSVSSGLSFIESPFEDNGAAYDMNDMHRSLGDTPVDVSGDVNGDGVAAGESAEERDAARDFSEELGRMGLEEDGEEPRASHLNSNVTDETSDASNAAYDGASKAQASADLLSRKSESINSSLGQDEDRPRFGVRQRVGKTPSKLSAGPSPQPRPASYFFAQEDDPDGDSCRMSVEPDPQSEPAHATSSASASGGYFASGEGRFGLNFESKTSPARRRASSRRRGVFGGHQAREASPPRRLGRATVDAALEVLDSIHSLMELAFDCERPLPPLAPSLFYASKLDVALCMCRWQ